VIRFPVAQPNISSEEIRSAADRILAIPILERRRRVGDLGIENPEVLLLLCELLRKEVERFPANGRDEAEYFFEFLERPPRQVGSFDEREYFLGEFALTAGAACRFLFRKEEARLWFARAEANFVMAHNSSANIARLAYQRLALRVEERAFEEVLELAPLWAENFRRLGLSEEALKCSFLEGASLREMGKISEAVEVFRGICEQAESQSNTRLLAQAANGLAQFYRVLGDLKQALDYATKALPLLEKLDNRINLAKLRWCVGDILREQDKHGEAMEAYRAALRESETIGIRGDVAAIHLVIADLLLDAGHERQAEWEIRAALPIIEEEQMVPEGVAALTLLRESLRRRQINRQALRDLHGYFQDNG